MGQPIATAPRNTPILITDGTYIEAVELTPYNPKSPKDFLIYPVSFSAYDYGWEFNDHALTHWMPISELLPGGTKC